MDSTPGLAEPLVGYSPVIDFDAMAESMRPIINSWKNQGYCIIVDPNATIRSRDILAGTSAVMPIPLGSGPCRIQPIKSNLTERNQTNDTDARTIQFWLDFPKDQTIPDIRPGFEIIVTNGGNDPYLSSYQYPVIGAMNSSMAWQRTIQATVNMEAQPQYKWSFLLGRISNAVGVTVLIEYQDINLAWQTYLTEVTTSNTYHIPIFFGGSYRATYSKSGYIPQTITVPDITLHDDTQMPLIVLTSI